MEVVLARLGESGGGAVAGRREGGLRDVRRASDLVMPAAASCCCNSIVVSSSSAVAPKAIDAENAPEGSPPPRRSRSTCSLIMIRTKDGINRNVAESQPLIRCLS
jgi:hypothetical protein